MISTENIVKQLEAEGVIPKGKYFAAFEVKETASVVVVTADGKIGLLHTEAGFRSLPAKFEKIKPNSDGTFTCYGKDNYSETYDSQLNRIK